ncbi:MAG: hypothetical protein AAFY60_01960, partial [Myxococcota bacterium]
RFAILGALAAGLLVGGLLGGTQGKILTDPLNAFKNWSWAGFVGGAAVGVAAAGVGVALGAAGGAIGAGVKKVVTEVYSKAILRAALAYAKGGDGKDVLKAFGLGAASGLMSGTGFFGMAKLSKAGEFFAKQVSTLADSALKLAADKKASLSISLWMFSLTIDQRGQAAFGIDFKFLGKSAVKLLGDLTKESGWGKPLGNFAVNIAKSVKIGTKGATGAAYGLDGFVSKAAVGSLDLFSTAKQLGTSLISFGASEGKKIDFVKDLSFAGELAIDGAKSGLEYGLGKGLCALDPQGEGC